MENFNSGVYIITNIINNKIKNAIKLKLYLKFKKIVQLDNNNNLIEIFESLKDAKLKFNSNSGGLNQALRNSNRTFKGFKWKFYKEWLENNK